MTSLSFKQKLSQKWAITRKFVQERKQIVTLVALVLACLLVYGWMFMRSRGSTRHPDLSPQVAKVIAGWKGKLPQFPMFGPPAGFQRGDWRKMTAAQRHAMFMKRRVQMQAFFLAFAHANAAQQAAIIAAAKARFAAMRARWQQHGATGGPGGHRGGPGGHGNFAAHLPQMMANHLISGGNPEMHAAMMGFFMAMHNSK
ncbi:MAG: hypothetical protein ACP5I8_10615 [Phycisphaerae bacterium]